MTRHRHRHFVRHSDVALLNIARRRQHGIKSPETGWSVITRIEEVEGVRYVVFACTHKAVAGPDAQPGLRQVVCRDCAVLSRSARGHS